MNLRLSKTVEMIVQKTLLAYACAVTSKINRQDHEYANVSVNLFVHML